LAFDAVLFYLFGTLAVAASLLVIGQRNPVYSVLLLIVSFAALAGLYVLLDAPFTAVTQMIVYAGAIMVLFIFVVMILNREEVAPLALRPMRLLGVAAAVYLLVVFADVVAQGVATDQVPKVLPETYGTVAEVGNLLFREFLYPFEAISLLLLVAIVGGVVVSRSHQKEVAAIRAAEYRKQVQELASADYPGQQEAPAADAGGHH
jgi:NADH-quinone oxidoreductase subunit J